MGADLMIYVCSLFLGLNIFFILIYQLGKIIIFNDFLVTKDERISIVILLLFALVISIFLVIANAILYSNGVFL